MVYTKHFTISSLAHLKKANSYIENESKTTVENLDDHLAQLFPYIANGEKTMGFHLVSGYHISNIYEAEKEFYLTKEIFARKKGTYVELDSKTGKLFFDRKKMEEGDKRGRKVLAHHLIQSFSPEDELTPEQVHEIGRKTMMEFTGGEYEFVIATHVDREHLHNHVIMNSTNFITGKQYAWKISNHNGKRKDLTKLTFENISDKIASQYGAKIIEKSPKTSHKKYTLWQVENIYKRKIKKRLDFLIEHSDSIPDLIQKAKLLNLEVNFSGKHARYKLLDEPQLKYTRGRTLDKTNPIKYNLQSIKEQLTQNDLIFEPEQVVELYEEKEERYEVDFDYQVKIERWQVHHTTEKGYYVNVDGGIGNRGQIFIGAYKVDPQEDGSCLLYIKRKENFYFTNQEYAERNKTLTGEMLMKQLTYYNGSVPLRKDPSIEKLYEIVQAINFLAENEIHDGRQLQNLENKLQETIETTYATLKELDERVSELTLLTKKVLLEAEAKEEYSEELKQELLKARVSPKISYQELLNKITEVKDSRELLQMEFKQIQKDIQQYKKIEYESEKINRTPKR